MPIAPSPKKEPRPIPSTFRISRKASEQLRKLAAMLNKSQGEIVDQLIQDEFKAQEFKKK